MQNIKIATYHNLAGRDVAGSIFMNDSGEMKVHSTYVPMKIVSSIFDDSTLCFSASEISSMCYQYDLKIQNIQEPKYSFWINWSDSSIVAPLETKKRINIHEYFGEEMYFTGDSTDRLNYIERNNVVLDQVKIRPYSITKVTFIK